MKFRTFSKKSSMVDSSYTDAKQRFNKIKIKLNQTNDSSNHVCFDESLFKVRLSLSAESDILSAPVNDIESEFALEVNETSNIIPMPKEDDANLMINALCNGEERSKIDDLTVDTKGQTFIRETISGDKDGSEQNIQFESFDNNIHESKNKDTYFYSDASNSIEVVKKNQDHVLHNNNNDEKNTLQTVKEKNNKKRILVDANTEKIDENYRSKFFINNINSESNYDTVFDISMNYEKTTWPKNNESIIGKFDIESINSIDNSTKVENIDDKNIANGNVRCDIDDDKNVLLDSLHYKNIDKNTRDVSNLEIDKLDFNSPAKMEETENIVKIFDNDISHKRFIQHDTNLNDPNHLNEKINAESCNNKFLNEKNGYKISEINEYKNDKNIDDININCKPIKHTKRTIVETVARKHKSSTKGINHRKYKTKKINNKNQANYKNNVNITTNINKINENYLQNINNANIIENPTENKIINNDEVFSYAKNLNKILLNSNIYIQHMKNVTAKKKYFEFEKINDLIKNKFAKLKKNARNKSKNNIEGMQSKSYMQTNNKKNQNHLKLIKYALLKLKTIKPTKKNDNEVSLVFTETKKCNSFNQSGKQRNKRIINSHEKLTTEVDKELTLGILKMKKGERNKNRKQNTRSKVKDTFYNVSKNNKIEVNESNTLKSINQRPHILNYQSNKLQSTRKVKQINDIEKVEDINILGKNEILEMSLNHYNNVDSSKTQNNISKNDNGNKKKAIKQTNVCIDLKNNSHTDLIGRTFNVFKELDNNTSDKKSKRNSTDENSDKYTPEDILIGPNLKNNKNTTSKNEINDYGIFIDQFKSFKNDTINVTNETRKRYKSKKRNIEQDNKNNVNTLTKDQNIPSANQIEDIPALANSLLSYKKNQLNINDLVEDEIKTEINTPTQIESFYYDYSSDLNEIICNNNKSLKANLFTKTIKCLSFNSLYKQNNTKIIKRDENKSSTHKKDQEEIVSTALISNNIVDNLENNIIKNEGKKQINNLIKNRNIKKKLNLSNGIKSDQTLDTNNIIEKPKDNVVNSEHYNRTFYSKKKSVNEKKASKNKRNISTKLYDNKDKNLIVNNRTDDIQTYRNEEKVFNDDASKIKLKNGKDSNYTNENLVSTIFDSNTENKTQFNLDKNKPKFIRKASLVHTENLNSRKSVDTIKKTIKNVDFYNLDVDKNDKSLKSKVIHNNNNLKTIVFKDDPTSDDTKVNSKLKTKSNDYNIATESKLNVDSLFTFDKEQKTIETDVITKKENSIESDTSIESFCSDNFKNEILKNKKKLKNINMHKNKLNKSTKKSLKNIKISNKDISTHIKDFLNLPTFHFRNLPNQDIKKVGEATFSEVFLVNNQIYKIMQLTTMKNNVSSVNDFLKECYINKVLSKERGIIQMNDCMIVHGCYPMPYIKAWSEYVGGENVRPRGNNLYGVIVMEEGGIDLEKFEFESLYEVDYFYREVVTTLNRLERKFNFEHRDLHWGNILINRNKNNNKVLKNIKDSQKDVANKTAHNMLENQENIHTKDINGGYKNIEDNIKEKVCSKIDRVINSISLEINNKKFKSNELDKQQGVVLTDNDGIKQENVEDSIEEIYKDKLQIYEDKYEINKNDCEIDKNELEIDKNNCDNVTQDLKSNNQYYNPEVLKQTNNVHESNINAQKKLDKNRSENKSSQNSIDDIFNIILPESRINNLKNNGYEEESINEPKTNGSNNICDENILLNNNSKFNKDKKNLFTNVNTIKYEDLIYDPTYSPFKINIIDFTLSRLDHAGKTIYTNLDSKKWLFEGDSNVDIQFGVYNKMRRNDLTINKNVDWETFNSNSNYYWFEYLLKKIEEKIGKNIVNDYYYEKMKGIKTIKSLYRKVLQ
ncbi:hypothetical protein COBT_000104, partial [Conglomerata obtusa]